MPQQRQQQQQRNDLGRNLLQLLQERVADLGRAPGAGGAPRPSSSSSGSRRRGPICSSGCPGIPPPAWGGPRPVRPMPQRMVGVPGPFAPHFAPPAYAPGAAQA
ncbi:hypothetical protein APUTEX25_004607, partial [Auxenochlorella protothecoides]